MTDQAEIANKVVQLLSTAPGQRLVGTELATVLKSTCGYSSAVYGKLRDFVDSNVPDVVRVGQAGKDWIYQLKSSVAGDELRNPNSATSLVESDRDTRRTILDNGVWKAFASPNTKFKLFVNRETGEVRVLPPGTCAPDGPWQHLPPCSTQSHLEIAHAWVQSLTDPNTRICLETALRAGSGPASVFFEAVQRLALTPQWNRFRTHRILAIFRDELRSFGFTSQQQTASSVRVPARTVTHQQRDTSQRYSEVRRPQGDAREVAVFAVQRMSESEIRSLAIPLGYILDILRDNR